MVELLLALIAIVYPIANMRMSGVLPIGRKGSGRPIRIRIWICEGTLPIRSPLESIESVPCPESMFPVSFLRRMVPSR
jgi:hypothetical protein